MDSSERIWQERGLRDAVVRGDEAAWRALYEGHFSSIFAYVYHRAGRDVHRTEDVVQDCWLVAVRRIGSFDPSRGSFESWLRGIADHLLLNERRRWQRRQTAELSESGGVAEKGESERDSAEAHRVDLAEQLGLALTGLPGRYQAVLAAKYGDERSVAEIAAAWGETPKAIESLLSRARAAFREAFRRLDSPP